jgi:serine/threonine protein kinase
LYVTRKRKTQANVRMGTLVYMSPEQIRGASLVDARSDVFSLGAILYELATGHCAFERDSEFDTMTAIVSGSFEPPEGVVVGLHPMIAACVRKALEVDPSKRFQSCKDFQIALAASGEPETQLPSEPSRSSGNIEPAFPEVRRPGRRDSGNEQGTTFARVHHLLKSTFESLRVGSEEPPSILSLQTENFLSGQHLHLAWRAWPEQSKELLMIVEEACTRLVSEVDRAGSPTAEAALTNARQCRGRPGLQRCVHLLERVWIPLFLQSREPYALKALPAPVSRDARRLSARVLRLAFIADVATTSIHSRA